MTAAKPNPSFCPQPFRTCSPTARTASPSAWRPCIPPHNVAEICDALRHLIQIPNAISKNSSASSPAPISRPAAFWSKAARRLSKPIKTGKGSFRLRAKWEKEDLKQGAWQIVVTEIPFQVQKSRLIEKMAELLQLRKLPLLDDVQRRIRRRCARGADAQKPQCRSCRADGIRFPPTRPGNAHPA